MPDIKDADEIQSAVPSQLLNCSRQFYFRHHEP